MVSNDTVTFTNTSTGAITYMWDFGGFGSSMAQDTTFVFPSNGMHTVELIAMSGIGCADTISQNVAITVGIDEPGMYNLSLYPNPAQNSLNIVNAVSGQRVEMQIIDMAGKLVYSDQLTGAVNLISLDGIAEGQYIVRFANGLDIRFDKLQIVR